MKKIALLFALLFTIAGLGQARGAEVIKLGTLAPSGSAWHNLLKEMGQKWKAASGGQVILRIYPGGVVGNEGDMVKKMRIGQLQAAALTAIGMHEISPEAQAVDVPMMIDSWQTLDYVMSRMAPELDKAYEQKGYVVMSWSEIGFVRFFSTRRYNSLAALKGGKIFSWQGDSQSTQAWQRAGFHPIVLSSTDIVPSLETGLIDTVAMSPLYAFSSRIFERAKYMMDVPWSPLTGAMVVKKSAWDRIPADLRPKLLAIAGDYAKKIDAEVRRMDNDALKTMKSQGLVVVTPTDPQSFATVARASYPAIRGPVVPAATFDEVQRLVAEAHKQGK